MDSTLAVQIPAPVVETHREFVAAAVAARVAGPDEGQKTQARHQFAATYQAFEIECRQRGLDIPTMRSLLGEPDS